MAFEIADGGSNQLARSNTDTDLPGGADGTVCATFKIQSAPGTSTTDIIEYNIGRLWDINFGGTGATGTVHSHVSSGGQASRSLTGNTGTWIRVVMRYDHSAGTYDFDIINVDTGALIDAVNDVSGGPLNFSSAALLRFRNGDLFDLRAYDYATWNKLLSDSEVVDLYDTEVSDLSGSTPYRWYRFDKTSGSVVGTETELQERTGNGQPLDIVTGTVTWVDDKPAALTPSETQIASAALHSNGLWVDVTFQTTSGQIVEPASPAGMTFKKNTVPVTTNRVQKIAGLVLRYWLANGSANRGLVGDTFTLDYSQAAGSVVDDGGVELAETADYAVTNNSEQTSTTIRYNRCTLTFPSAVEAGISLAGLPRVKTGVNVSSAAAVAQGDEAQLQVVVQNKLNAGPTAAHSFDSRAAYFSAGSAVAFPYTPSDGDVLVAGLSIADDDPSDWQATTAYSLGDVLGRAQQGGWFRLCVQAGTSGASEPTWSASGGAIDNDGTVQWENHQDNPLHRYAVIEFTSDDDVFNDQDRFCRPYSSGATDQAYTRSDIQYGNIPSEAAEGDEDTVAQALAKVALPWVEHGSISNGKETIAFEHQPNFGRDMAEDANDVLRTIITATDPKTHLVEAMLQQAIFLIGVREGGGYWSAIDGGGEGGHPHGRLAFSLIGAHLLNDMALVRPILRNPSSGGSHAFAGFGESDQVGYMTSALVATTFDNVSAADPDFQYSSGAVVGNDTYVNPDTAPSTYGDTMPQAANNYFPASVRVDWNHVPEWASPFQVDFSLDPRWADAQYRQCCSGRMWHVLADLFYRFGIEDQFDLPAFFDYCDRYGYCNNETRSARGTAARDAFAVSSASLDGSTLTVTFNRYCTWSSANDGAWTLDDGTLSGWAQTAPRIWTATVSGGASPTQVTYTAASGDATDAGNNALGNQTVGFDPAVESATINSDGNVLVITIDALISLGADGSGGFVLNMSGGPVVLTYNGLGDSTIAFNLSRTVIQSETGTVDYTQPGDGVLGASVPLPSFTNYVVTNNSTKLVGSQSTTGRRMSFTTKQVCLGW